MRVCARCGTLWLGKAVECRRCKFGSYDAVWVYDGHIRALIKWFKQLIRRKEDKDER